MTEKRKLHVDMGELLLAMEAPESPEMQAYLDLATGEVRMLFDSAFSGEEDDPLAAELEQSPDRFAVVRTRGSREKYDLMCHFAGTVDEEDIRDMLDLALRGKGAFARFRDVVFAYPDLEERWRAMEREAAFEAAVDWLADLEIEPVYELPPPRARAAEPSPEPRAGKRPRIDLLDLLLLGAPGGETELVDGRVLRRIRVRSPSEARALFKSLARDLCAYFGLAWRKRHVQGRTTFELERAHLRVSGTDVELAIDVPAEAWAAFQEPT